MLRQQHGDCLGKSDCLIEPEQPGGETQSAGFGEEPFQCDRADEIPFHAGLGAAGFHFRARKFDHLRVVHARGTGRLTGQATQAEIHLVRELRGVRRKPAIGDRAHQGNASAWTARLMLRRVVRRAARQTHPAMDALLENGIVELFQQPRLSRRFCRD